MRVLGSLFISLAALWAHPSAASWHSLSDDSTFSCSMYQEFADDGDTVVLVSRYADGKSHLAVTNRGWSAAKSETYPLALAFDDEVIGAAGIGVHIYPRTGFAIHLSEEAIEHFRRSKALVIFHADNAAPIVYLSLKGSSAGLNEMDQCLRRQATTYQAKLDHDAALERKRKLIPADPFASSKGQPNVDLSQSGSPQGNPSRWVQWEDMPQEALTAGISGTTGYRLHFDETGKVETCEITSTAGHAILDSTACELLKLRAVFNPGKDSDGRATGGTYSNRIRWMGPN